MMTFTRPAAVAAKTLGTSVLVLALVCAAGERARVAAADLCISMSNSDGQVAGLQLDLKWDGNCMSADAGRGTAAKCTADPATGKEIHSRVLPGPTLKSIFVSLADTSPIPDGDLYCCSFSYAAGKAGGCCGLSMGNVLGSDPTGGANRNFTLLATIDGQFCAASDTGGSQPPPARGPLQREPAYQPPPAVSAPGGGAPQAPEAQAPAGQAPAGQAPAGRAPAAAPQGAAPQAPVGGIPAGAEQAPGVEAPQQPAGGQAAGKPTEAPTRPAATLRPWPTPRRTPKPATSPTAKHRTPAGTPTVGRATPVPAGSGTPGGTTTPSTPAPKKKKGRNPPPTPKRKS